MSDPAIFRVALPQSVLAHTVSPNVSHIDLPNPFLRRKRGNLIWMQKQNELVLAIIHRLYCRYHLQHPGV